MLLLATVAAAAAGCGGAERARQAEIGALRSQIEELKKSQDASAREIAKLGEALKAADAQSAFLVGEAKTSAEERERVKAAIGQQDNALRSLRASVEEALRKAEAATPPPAPPRPAPAPPVRDSSAEKLYARAMASFRAEELGQAVLEFTELTEKFAKDPLAASAQHWIGEAYYRQRDFRQALTEFQKVVDVYPQSLQVPESLLKIGLCYRALHDVDHARETWEQVAKSYPTSDAATQARALLTALGPSGRRPR